MAKQKYHEGDYIGINNILFIKRTTKSKNGQWNALFECPYCGNIFEAKMANVVNGHTSSCGCLNKMDLLGKTFGRLTVLEDIGLNHKGNKVYKCKCECGNIVNVLGRYLISGGTTSCGCYQKECVAKVGKKCAIDLAGQRFGRLIAIKPVQKTKEYKSTSKLWLCKCDCGNYTKVYTASLRNHSVESCGKCHFSKGEEKISKILQNLSIDYLTEYKEFNCYNPKTNRKLIFDFYIPSKNICIEYDGIQHFEETNWRHESLLDVQYRDKIKDKYCINHNIGLIRIPYWDYDKLNEEYLLSLINNIK